VEAKLTVIVQVAQGAKMCGASKIIGVDLNPDKEEVGMSLHFPFAVAACLLILLLKSEEKTASIFLFQGKLSA
jgi:S-(hydroxymethyl)glutathione dehydrogenase/alcohol dehydrogenase